MGRSTGRGGGTGGGRPHPRLSGALRIQ
jgi:hypothetical protein